MPRKPTSGSWRFGRAALGALVVGWLGVAAAAAAVTLASGAPAAKAPPPAARAWSIEAALGAPVNLVTPLRFHQPEEPDLRFDANYRTRPFARPLYYSVRVGAWRGKRAWELELLHHKLFLRTPPPEVRSFSVSHGYNLITLQRVWGYRSLLLRFGLGAVLAHPEGEVRGVRIEQAYRWTGPAAALGVGRRWSIDGGVFLALEGRFTAARARLPLERGYAEAPNLAFHLLGGLGWDFGG